MGHCLTGLGPRTGPNCAPFPRERASTRQQGWRGMMSFEVEPLSPDLPFGVTIRGLRRAHLDDEQVRERLRQHWIQDGLAVFRDGDCDEPFHVALSKVFGPLELHPVVEIR